MWKEGPLPPDTYNWGGVVLAGQEGLGFYFADFVGDHVLLVPSGKRIEPKDIKMYNNSLDLPPRECCPRPCAESNPTRGFMSRAVGTLLAFTVLVASASAQDFKSLAAGCLAMHANYKPDPTPKPLPTPTEICDNCNGRGKVGDGTVMVTCPVCDGSGKKKVTDLPASLLPRTPDLGPGARKAATKTVPVPQQSQEEFCGPEGCSSESGGSWSTSRRVGRLFNGRR